MSLRQDFVAVNEISLNLCELIVSLVSGDRIMSEDKDLTVLKLPSTLAKQFVVLLRRVAIMPPSEFRSY